MSIFGEMLDKNFEELGEVDVTYFDGQVRFVGCQKEISGNCGVTVFLGGDNIITVRVNSPDSEISAGEDPNAVVVDGLSPEFAKSLAVELNQLRGRAEVLEKLGFDDRLYCSSGCYRKLGDVVEEDLVGLLVLPRAMVLDIWERIRTRLLRALTFH